MSDEITNTDNAGGHYEDDSRWEAGEAPEQVAPTVKQARAKEAAAKAEVAELIRLVESGDDLSAEERIPAAQQAAESAERIRKGVERQAQKAAHEAFLERVDEFRQEVVSVRERNDGRVDSARSDAADALDTFVATVTEVNRDASQLESEVRSLRSDAEAVSDFASTEGQLRAAASMVRRPQSAVIGVAELVVQALRTLVEDGAPLPRRERELYEIIRAYLGNDTATLQGVLKTLPGTMGHVSYGR